MAGLKVLIIDENEKRSEQLNQLLAGTYQVQVAQHLEEALDILDREEFSIIILSKKEFSAKKPQQFDRVVRFSPESTYLLIGNDLSKEDILWGLRNGISDFIETEKNSLGSQKEDIWNIFHRAKEDFWRGQNLKELDGLSLLSSQFNNMVEIVRGAIHDVSNRLGSIQYQTMAMKRDFEKSGEVPDSFLRGYNKISQHIPEISSTFHNLGRVFLTPQEDQLVTRNLHQLIKDVICIFEERLTNHNIELKVSAVSEEVKIECYPRKIYSAFFSLLINSFLAIKGQYQETAQEGTTDSTVGDGKKAVVEQVKDHWIEIDVRELNEEVELRFIDSGPGIGPANRERIFLPFFTTRKDTYGAGLGLSVLKMILQSHGGGLKLEEDSPHTCFSLRLPIVRA